ncbi:hypothetical protein [Aeromonas phage ZPAH34]|uniref:hypothetical protein n=1 Tax=Aeromonas phage ZPAH34 TaxID=2924888 RepID=UPI0023296A82|nr:hypothetical protein PQD16_gp013 [Aeromonas phage ZPAH34]UOX39670.1 hypothetical protein [Aeromonas phage ZPAH34]
MIQLVEDIDFGVSQTLNNSILTKTSVRSYQINDTKNRLISIHGNKFTGLGSKLKFVHDLKENGYWESKVSDLINNKEVTIAKGFLTRGEDLI